MTDTTDSKRHFFVSFNQADRAWATWIAWVLEEKGYSVFFQDWDFRRNFVEHMDEAHRKSAWTIAVLSDNYFDSKFARLELSARIAKEPGRLIPVRVGSLSEDHILDAMLYADLTGCDEAAAEQRLLGHIKKWIDPTYRPKPETPPGFPGGPARQVPQKPRFPVPSHNLPPPNPDFVGREDVLAAIRKALTKSAPGVISQAYAITGLGGIGKTQTALAYCYQHLADYHLIWWLRAAEPATLAVNFMALAGPLGLPEERDQAKAVQAVKAKLQATPGWLLVLDHAEEPELLRAFLPTTGQGHVLITSRRSDWQGIAKALPLKVMLGPEALQLLTGRSDPDTLPPADLAQAKALAEELGHLPLALAQAQAYMAKTGKSLAGYRKLLQASRPAVLASGRASPDYPASVAMTWQISIAAAEDRCVAARPLLELLAFFASDPLPVEVLASAPATLPEGLGDELKRDDAIAALHRFSLLRAEAGTLTVHRLVQAVTRDGLDEATARAYAGAALQLVKAALPRPPWEHTNWPAIGALLPHALATAEAAERLEAGLETAATVLTEIARYHQARAAYTEAEALYKRALAIREKTLGPEHPDVAQSLNNELAPFYCTIGRYAESERLVQRALKIQEKVLGPEHPNVGWSLRALAMIYHAQGRYAEAEPICEQALTLLEKAFGPDHRYVARALHTLAALYQAQGRYAEAEKLLNRTLAIREKALGPEHPEVAWTLLGLAELHHAQSRYNKAEECYQQALMLLEKALPGHPDVVRGLEGLANFYQAQGRYAEAEKLLKRALAIREKTLGPEHPGVAESFSALARLYHNQGRYAEAEELLNRALAIREKTLGPTHPDVAWDLHDLAALYLNQGHYTKAKPLYHRVFCIRKKVLGPKHPQVAATCKDLGWLLFKQGRYTKAGTFFKRALAIEEKMFGPEHLNVAWTYHALAELYHVQGRYAEAEACSQKALRLFEKNLGLEHPDVARGLHALAALYQTLGRYTEAEPLLQRALAIREKALGPEHSEVAWTLLDLARGCHAQGRYADAEPLYQKALRIFEKSFGSEHPGVARSLEGRAKLHQAQGRYAEAEPLYQRALAIRDKTLGPEHPDVATSLHNLAALYQTLGRDAKAEPLLQRALAIREKALGPEHPDVAVIRKALKM